MLLLPIFSSRLMSLVSFFVSGIMQDETRATNRNISRYAKGRCEKTFPLRALPKTPKHIMQLVPLPLSPISKSSGRYTPSTNMMLEPQSRMSPSMVVCTYGNPTMTSANKSSIRLPISNCSSTFLLQFLTMRKKVILAIVSTTPTTILLIYSDIPKRSSVNWVRQQNICIMNMRMDPPMIAKICLGKRIYLIDLYLNISLFSMNSCVYCVSMMAPTAQASEQAIRQQKNMLLSATVRKKTPRVISLSAHPTNTLTVFSSALFGQFSLMNTKVRLLRGPMQRLARMKPACRSTSKIVELMNKRQELTTNIHRRPTMSDRMPAEKLPSEYARKVQRVRVSKSAISRKMTLSTKSPESQNSPTSSQTKAPFAIIQLQQQKQQKKVI